MRRGGSDQIGRRLGLMATPTWPCHARSPGLRGCGRIAPLRGGDRRELSGKLRLSHPHRGFADDEAGPEPDHPGDTPRVRADGNTSTRRWIVVPFMGRWAQPSRPGIDAGSPEQPSLVRSSPAATPEPRSRGFSVWGFSRRAQAPTARNPVNGVATPPREWWATRRQRRAYTAAAKARERACRSPVVRRPARKTSEKPDSR